MNKINQNYNVLRAANGHIAITFEFSEVNLIGEEDDVAVEMGYGETALSLGNTLFLKLPQDIVKSLRVKPIKIFEVGSGVITRAWQI